MPLVHIDLMEGRSTDKIERMIKDQAPEKRHSIRQEKAEPILKGLREWLDRQGYEGYGLTNLLEGREFRELRARIIQAFDIP